ncbi:MAG: saccharopine dehydrogenase family protein [Anaerolineae bacterium]
MSGFKYAVVGAGRQGTAAAYDMVMRGGAASVALADYDGNTARAAAERINRLVGREVATGVQLDVRDYDALVAFLEGVDVYLCAAPYRFIPACTQAAIHARTSMVDLGGHTETVLRQLDMNDEAKAAGISIVPDCGMGPGLNNTMGLYTVEQLEARGAVPREVRIWDGGLPVDPPEPWGYQASFHINGLTNEYSGKAVFLRDGKITLVDTFTELEILEFEGLGKLEAFVASGGTSTVPYTYEGKLQIYENKICRYPGHFAQFKAFKDLGLFEEEPIEIVPGKVRISPREFYHALLGPQIEVDQVIDICVMRARGTGELNGRDISLVVDLVDGYDEATGFNGMERLTGWHAAIMCEFIARGEVGPGVWPMEKAVTSTRFMEKIRERGFKVTERWEE